MKFPLMQPKPTARKPSRTLDRCVTCGGETTEADPEVEVTGDEVENLLHPRDPDSPILVTPGYSATTMRRCASCQEIAQRAAAVADRHPFLVGKLGYKEHAAHQFELALIALDAVGYDMGALDQILAGAKGGRAAALLIDGRLRLRDLGAAASLGGWASPTLTIFFRDVLDRPARRWQHITDEELVQLRDAAAQYRLRLLEHETDAPVPETSDFRGCLMCGISSVRASSVAVHNGDVWKPVGKTAVELGGRPGPGGRSERLSGHLCPTCAAAAGNAAGHHQVEDALWGFLGRPAWARDSEADAALRRVKAWAVSPGAQDGVTNTVPWEHVAASIRETLAMPAVHTPDAPLAELAGAMG